MLTLHHELDFDKMAKFFQNINATAYLEFRFRNKIMTSLDLEKDYQDNNYIAYGIYETMNNGSPNFVGVIRLHGINKNHNRVDKHTLIDPEKHGQGIGTWATKELLRLEGPKFRLICAGCYSTNPAVLIMNIKAGFKINGIRPNYFNDADLVLMSWFNKNFTK